VAGGTAYVTTPTSTVSTTPPAVTRRRTLTVWCGSIGRAMGIRSDLLR